MVNQLKSLWDSAHYGLYLGIIDCGWTGIYFCLKYNNSNINMWLGKNLNNNTGLEKAFYKSESGYTFYITS